MIDPNLSFMRQLQEYETKLGYGPVVDTGLNESESCPSPHAKRPCLTLPINSLLSQSAITPTLRTKDSVSFVFDPPESPLPGQGSRSQKSSPHSGGSPTSGIPTCHSPLISQVCHSPLLSSPS